MSIFFKRSKDKSESLYAVNQSRSQFLDARETRNLRRDSMVNSPSRCDERDLLDIASCLTKLDSSGLRLPSSSRRPSQFCSSNAALPDHNLHHQSMFTLDFMVSWRLCKFRRVVQVRLRHYLVPVRYLVFVRYGTT
jgi:hypothetical protein